MSRLTKLLARRAIRCFLVGESTIVARRAVRRHALTDSARQFMASALGSERVDYRNARREWRRDTRDDPRASQCARIWYADIDDVPVPGCLCFVCCGLRVDRRMLCL